MSIFLRPHYFPQTTQIANTFQKRCFSSDTTKTVLALFFYHRRNEKALLPGDRITILKDRSYVFDGVISGPQTSTCDASSLIKLAGVSTKSGLIPKDLADEINGLHNARDSLQKQLDSVDERMSKACSKLWKYDPLNKFR